MKIEHIKAFKDAKQIWLGLDEEGLRRKVFRAVDHEQLGAERMVAGLTIFEPGERCAPHNHPGSEEVNFVVEGSGIAYDIDNGTEFRFSKHDFIWIPDGMMHVHYNDGDEPLLLFWCYAPPGDLPTR